MIVLGQSCLVLFIICYHSCVNNSLGLDYQGLKNTYQTLSRNIVPTLTILEQP